MTLDEQERVFNKYSPNFPPTTWSTPLNILHFHDVYEVKAGKREPVGGAARFVSKLKEFKEENPLVLFSGGALNPSSISTVTRGAHMIELFHMMGVHAAVVGSNDLDYGVENLAEQIAASNFPWICSNAVYKETGKPLANAEEWATINHAGKKIGLVGLIEEDWLACTTIDPSAVRYIDFVSKGKELAGMLRDQEQCDIVIALTHFREVNDKKLAREAGKDFDIILGGHDHTCVAQKEGTTWYVKSGSDFKSLSKILISNSEDGKGPISIDVDKIEITSGVVEDEEASQVVQTQQDQLKASMTKVLGETAEDLDGRFASVRTGETNLGNWVADVVRVGCRADVALVTSGTLRADTVFSKGGITVEDIGKLVSFSDRLNVVALQGTDLLQVLENGVSQYPKLEGRFPQVSGIAFKFDPESEPGKRVLAAGVTVGEAPLDPYKFYTVATTEVVAQGKDGYEAITSGNVVMDGDMCPTLPTLLRNHLTGLKVLKKGDLNGAMKNLKMSTGDVFNREEAKALITAKVDGRIENTQTLDHLTPDLASLSGAPKLRGSLILNKDG